jgi:hypothetical protein
MSRVAFHEAFDAVLDLGTYHVAVAQKVASTAAKTPFEETFTGTFDLEVAGPRVLLPPGYVHAQYPAPGTQGDVSRVLPHVAFEVETLPWQRSALVMGNRRDEDPPYPWVALLSFDRDDPLPPVWSGTLDDLLPEGLPAGTVSYPGFALEPGQQGSDPCQFVDVPAELFAAIAPTLEELRWLAHGRHVDADAIAQKPLVAETAPTEDLSLVVSNRLPAPGHETLCCLVSVEHMAGVLPPNGVDADVVRLVVLHSWSFGCVEGGTGFEDAVTALDRHPATLRLRPDDSQPKVVREALEMGYAAFDHRTRAAARTVSWYRGPLLPFGNPRRSEVPFPSADSLVRYDPETGMFDVSLAAAWQLGRLLALADRGFATTLYDWKQGRLRSAVVDFERRQLAKHLALDPELLAEPGVPAHVAMMRTVAAPLLEALLDGERET